MSAPAGDQGSGWIEAVLLLIVAATLTPWVWIVRRLVARRPVLPYQPRRPVPWGALEVVLILLCFFSAGGLVFRGERPLLEGWAENHYGTPPSEAEPGTEHSLFLLLATDPSPATLALCFLSAVVVAPIAEEFFFRLLLQGWLERLERRVRRRMSVLRWLAPGVVSIVVTSAIFAALHYRTAPPGGVRPDAVQAFHELASGGIAYVLTVLFGVALLRTRAGASSASLGFVSGRFWADVRLGLVAALAVVGPVLLLQVLAQTFLMPSGVAADPVPIFFFALALGTLYCRTHRIVPSITLHMALNLTSLTLTWLSVTA